HTSNTTFLFAALAGWKAAHRYGLTGDHFDAGEALRLGLVNEVVPQAELLPRARALAERIARVPEPSVRFNKAVTCYGLLALGLDALWTEDRIFHQANLLDPLMLLASAASSTRRIRLGTAVLVLTLRNVAVVARQVSTLHHLSGGRVELGISLGGRPEEYRA